MMDDLGEFYVYLFIFFSYTLIYLLTIWFSKICAEVPVQFYRGSSALS